MYESWFKLFFIICGYVAAYAFGGWTEALSFLCILVVLDYITGWSSAIYQGIKFPNDKTKGLNSNKGFWGIFKKFLMFTVIALLHRVDILLGLDGALGFMVGAIWFYIGNEMISLVENYGKLDLPMPIQLKKVISIFKDKSVTEESDTSIKENSNETTR